MLKDISTSRAELVRRETSLADLELRLMTDLRPVEAKLLAIRVDTFRALGKHLRAGWLAKRDAKVLELALLDLANELEDVFGADLSADRHRFLEDERFSGNDFDDDQDGNESGDGNRAEGPSPAPPRSARPEEAVAGDIRALYLMLARALHPDKEPDPSRREEKTAWMQKVTAAYADRDLALLLDILGRNPLDAVGPYLSKAPLKTVQGFAKRLRRELEALRNRLAAWKGTLDPLSASFFRGGDLDESAYARHMAEARKDLKFFKQRLDAYRTAAGVNGLVEALRSRDWRELM